MTYQITNNGNIKLELEDGVTMLLPSEDNGTPEWHQYSTWLEEGNEPLPPNPLPEPEPLTAQQKLEAAGLSIEELKELLGL
jgi:hypothetical protein